jgi:hypothetical protein
VTRTACRDPMSIPFLTILFAILAMAIAVIPVLVRSAEGNRAVNEDGAATTHGAAREQNRRRSHLGRPTGRMRNELAPDTEATVVSGWQR